MRSRRNVALVFGARGHLGQSGCEDPVESLESCLYHARLASRRTTQSSEGGDPEGHPCRAYTVSYFKHETSSRISYLEIYLSSPNREAVDGANLVLAARLEEDRTGSAWADAARLGTGSYAGGSACIREETRLGSRQQGGAARLAVQAARRGLHAGRARHVRARLSCWISVDATGGWRTFRLRCVGSKRRGVAGRVNDGVADTAWLRNRLRLLSVGSGRRDAADCPSSDRRGAAGSGCKHDWRA
ncbi:hypothetical protein E5676_scaffold991G00120 [Cucumis melo var. makuwa]|uniref:Uncharacterized protein n=1 Tax=Cucumis melo var. makuwa TaxID=1194695 RepID=A0A5D3BNA8_CUCMM|nr:hypothetical protein E5676_scaffold562G00250 [Cucumis melo var. makuwa]TYK08706.1 hypothetical protein E5676_scaffold76G00010 [Cucumis melo var. makuwa]TYK14116.1 hypothetical protein E5676_scaffold1193G00360 [Cucumis melo var. makuwa]TYK21804.1 hypothetical protein E5676_scaffold991G00120 [Cucumis melo var. makuwa]